MEAWESLIPPNFPDIIRYMKYVKTLAPFFTDARGSLAYLTDSKFTIQSALLITCRKGSIRANHYHKKDTHVSYMISGAMEYSYQDMDKKNAKKRTVIVKAGQLVVSPPMVAHAMHFIEDSVFLALTTEKRGRSEYEKDTVRVPLI